MFVFLFALTAAADPLPPGWTDLTSSADARTRAWKSIQGEWVFADDARLDSANPRLLTGVGNESGSVLITGRGGKTRNLLTKQAFADLDVHLEFMIARHSNAGVKCMGLYEVQLLDSHGRKKLTGDDCGGIYPRAEDRPIYRYLDHGFPPRVNAAKPAGEWQSLDIEFLAPRFDMAGRKIANAKFVKVVLNDQIVQHDVELTCPTGAAWRHAKEVASGPLMLQCDHGPVAYRNVRVRPRGNP